VQERAAAWPTCLDFAPTRARAGERLLDALLPLLTFACSLALALLPLLLPPRRAPSPLCLADPAVPAKSIAATAPFLAPPLAKLRHESPYLPGLIASLFESWVRPQMAFLSRHSHRSAAEFRLVVASTAPAISLSSL